VAQTIDQFYIQIAKKTNMSDLAKSNVRFANETLQNLDFFGENINFLGVGSPNAVNTVQSSNVFRNGLMYVLDPSKQMEEKGLARARAGGFFKSFTTAEEAKGLRKVGLPFQGRQSIYLNPNIFANPQANPFKTIFHEIGHAASFASGASGEKTSLISRAQAGLSDTETTLTHGKIVDLVTDLLQGNAREEGRAEQFAFESLQRKFSSDIARGKAVSIDDLLTTSHVSYLEPSNWDRYLRPNKGLIGDAIRRMEGFTESSFNEVLDDISHRAKAVAIGTVHGHHKMISGELGSKISLRSEDAVLQMMDRVKDAGKRDKLLTIIEDSSEKVIKQNRRVVLGESMGATISSSGSIDTRLIAASVESNAVPQTIEEAVSVAVKRSGATGRLLHAASQASIAVAAGTSNSAALRGAGAALSILRGVI